MKRCEAHHGRKVLIYVTCPAGLIAQDYCLETPIIGCGRVLWLKSLVNDGKVRISERRLQTQREPRPNILEAPDPILSPGWVMDCVYQRQYMQFRLSETSPNPKIGSG